jgi:hypothetical protein
MVSKRNLRARACKRDIAHKNARAAYARRKPSAVFDERLGFYRCPWCGRYQLGHNQDNHDNRKLKAS